MAINILTVLKNFLLTFKKSLPAKKQTTRKNKYRKIQEKICGFVNGSLFLDENHEGNLMLK
jgi:hypothetical protein